MDYELRIIVEKVAERDHKLSIQKHQLRTMPAIKKIPAVALTAYAGDINQQQAIATGFQRHLAKPVEPDELVKALAQLVEEAIT